MNSLLRIAVASSFLVSAAEAAITVSSGSNTWSPIAGYSDAPGDQQTGQSSGDLVGSGINYGFLVGLEDHGDGSGTDGELFFRIRLDDAGWVKSDPSFGRVAWVGVDATLDGSIDVFVSANFTGSTAEIGIHAPGDGENISPNTTTIGSAFKIYTPTTENYNFRTVDLSIDGGDTNDLSPGTVGDVDYYVSFMVPFSDVVSYLDTKSITINDQSPLRFLVATSTQDNALNQDIGGVTGAPSPDDPWTDIGGITDPVTPGSPLVPEPSSSLMVLLSLGIGLLQRRRK